MESAEEIIGPTSRVPKLPIAAAVVALVGLVDSIYLTVHHLTAEPVPCSIVSGCETVLTSDYAEFAGVPIAAFGAAAYFLAFSLSLLAIFGNRTAWMIFGGVTVLMAGFTLWLLYLQAFVIGAFCQFCLLSAITSIVLFLIALVSKAWQR